MPLIYEYDDPMQRVPIYCYQWGSITTSDVIHYAIGRNAEEARKSIGKRGKPGKETRRIDGPRFRWEPDIEDEC